VYFFEESVFHCLIAATELKASVRHADNPNNDAVVAAVASVAEEIGAKPGQVAVAWVKAKGVLPVIGTRTWEQFEDHLGALNVTLNDEQLHRLDAVTVIALGYPHDLNSSPEQRAVMTGGRFDQIDYPPRVVL
jgi:diketogulonate reductase-like aldo/keto reductase